MNEYFKAYHSRKYCAISQFSREEEKLFEFWRKAINGLYKYVYCTASLTKHKIKSSFMINRVIPFGLDNIIRELALRRYLIPLDLLKSKSYYPSKEEKKQGWIRWFFSKLYNGTIGYFSSSMPAIADSISLVSVSYLKVAYRILITFLVFMEASIIKA